MQTVETYNGYTNWETWSVAANFQNDPYALGIAQHCVVAEDLRKAYIALVECSTIAPFGDHREYDKVDWEEVLESI